MTTKKKSELEETLAMQIRAVKLPSVAREYRFAAIHVGMGKGIRKRLAAAGLKNWRFDFAWPEKMFAVECEGGGFTNGRHVRGAGFAEDMKKYHEAQNLGWTIYRCDLELIKSGKAINLIERLLRSI